MPHSLRETRTGEFSRIFSGRTRGERDTEKKNRLSNGNIMPARCPAYCERRNAMQAAKVKKDYYYYYKRR